MNVAEWHTWLGKEAINAYGKPLYYPSPNGYGFRKDDPLVKNDKYGPYVMHEGRKWRGHYASNAVLWSEGAGRSG